MTALADVGLYPELQQFGADRHERLLQLRQLHGDLPARPRTTRRSRGG